MKASKKIISLVLALSCILTILPTSAMAASKSSASETTLYRYHRWVVKGRPEKSSLCPYSGGAKYGTKLVLEYSNWSTEKMEVANAPYNYFQHVHQGKACSSRGCIDKSCKTDRYIDENGTYWFYEERKVISNDSNQGNSATSSKLPDTSSTPKEESITLTSSSADDKRVWMTIGVDILNYAVDAISSVVDELDDSDVTEVGIAIATNRDCIKVLLDKALINRIDDDKIRDALIAELYKSQKPGATSGDSDDLKVIASLFVKAMKKDPRFAGECVKEGIKIAQRQIMSAITGGNIPAPMRVVIAVYESSCEAIYKASCAVVDLYNINVEHADVVADHFIRFENTYTEWLQLTCQAAIRDRENNSTQFLQGVRKFDELCTESRQLFLDEIARINTKTFKLFHRDQSARLERIAERVRAMDVNFETTYHSISNK